MLFHEQANDDIVRLAVFFSFTTITYFAWSISHVDDDSIEDDDELDQESNGESELDSLSLDASPFDQIEQTIGESILIARETFEHDRSFTIIVKFLNETQRIIDARPMDTVAKLKRKYFTDELTNNQTVRFIYQGRELEDSQTMQSCRITDQTVIHCHISHQRLSTGISSDLDEYRPDEFVDLSPLSLSLTHFLLITFVLGCIWYLRIEYRFLFKPISTLLLIFMNDAADDSEYLSASETFVDETYPAETDRKIRQSLSLNKEKLAPLATKWTFWLDPQKSKFSSKEDYEASLQIIFCVETVQAFWSVFNNIPAPSRLSNRVSYHLMRENRKPLWEDQENQNGGIYTYRSPKDKTNSIWQELCLAAIGEQFSTVDDDDIVGISVQSRDGAQDLVQIWNCNPSEQAQQAIDRKVSSLFPDITFNVKFYKPNSSHANFEPKSKN